MKKKVERGEVEAEIGEQTAELLNNYRSHNEKLTVENGRTAKELASLREMKEMLGNTVLELREELTRVANSAPENTGSEISAALKQQLDTYQEKAGVRGCEERGAKRRAEKALFLDDSVHRR